MKRALDSDFHSFSKQSMSSCHHTESNFRKDCLVLGVQNVGQKYHLELLAVKAVRKIFVKVNRYDMTWYDII